ncbi:MAG TPA: phytanoyl-CoA dioxygenase family protein [Bryobacteraceae bacterium]|nr:phytanoyl-CoA dioxygenase family protein [Bryobacteraceae bacterium]
MPTGFAILPRVLAPSAIDALVQAIENAPAARQRAGRGGVRDLLNRVPAVRTLSRSLPLRQLVDPVLGAHARPVRALLFDKTPAANWKVPWHQDLTLAVQARHDLPGYGPWTVKDGIPHVQPPVAVLENMLALRLHLDDCGEHNGPLRVLPGTHALGRLAADEIDELQQSRPAVTCLARRGDVILLRPLLLHASSPAAVPARRRVIHIEYASAVLPQPLCWYEDLA